MDFQNKLNALIHFLPQNASRYKHVVQNESIWGNAGLRNYIHTWDDKTAVRNINTFYRYGETHLPVQSFLKHGSILNVSSGVLLSV